MTAARVVVLTCLLSFSPTLVAGAQRPADTILAIRSGDDGINIISVRPDGTGETNLTNGNWIQPSSPHWSPDRTRIAFMSGGPADGEALGSDIYVMSHDGSNVRRLTPNPGGDIAPQWSPSGRRIVFLSYRRTAIFQVHVMRANGDDRKRLTSSYNAGSPTWSPDGKTILFTRSGVGSPSTSKDLFTISPSGRRLKNLTRTPRIDEDEGRYSPDGRWIVFQAYKANRRDTGPHIYIMRADGTDRRQLTSGRGSAEHSPSWSPNGVWIAFERLFGIYTIRRDGSDESPVFVTRSHSYLVPDWGW